MNNYPVNQTSRPLELDKTLHHTLSDNQFYERIKTYTLRMKFQWSLRNYDRRFKAITTFLNTIHSPDIIPEKKLTSPL